MQCCLEPQGQDYIKFSHIAPGDDILGAALQ